MGAEDKAVESSLAARVSELEAENASLLRQLQFRPIVYQFSADDDLGGPDDEDGLDDYAVASAAAAAAAARRALGGGLRNPEGGAASNGEGIRSYLVLAISALLQCRMLSVLSFRACRRQRLAQSLEKGLRQFT